MTLNEAYRIFDIVPGIEKTQVSKKFRILIKQVHPDVTHNPDDNQRTIELIEAYELIMADNIETVSHNNVTNEKDLVKSFYDSISKKYDSCLSEEELDLFLEFVIAFYLKKTSHLSIADKNSMSEIEKWVILYNGQHLLDNEFKKTYGKREQKEMDIYLKSISYVTDLLIGVFYFKERNSLVIPEKSK